MQQNCIMVTILCKVTENSKFPLHVYKIAGCNEFFQNSRRENIQNEYEYVDEVEISVGS